MKNGEMIQGEAGTKKKSVGKRVAAGAVGAAAYLAARGKVKKRYGSGMNSTKGMWKRAGEDAVAKAKGTVRGVVATGARKVKNAASRVERGVVKGDDAASRKAQAYVVRKKRGERGMSALLERCRELADGESKDRVGRFVLGTPIMGALNAPKGKRMAAFKKLKGHEAGETLKGAGKGGVVGAGAGALLAAAAAAKGKGKLMKRGGQARKVVMGRAGNEALRGAAAGAVVGGGAGLVGGSVKGHMGKKADELYVKAKRGELSALAERCRELALSVDERGEYPWQAHQREKRKDRMVKGAVGAAAVGGGVLVHRGVKRAGGYQAMGNRFNAVRRTASQVGGQGPIESTYRGAKAVANKVGKGVKAEASAAGSAVKGVGSKILDMVKKRRGVAGLLK